MEPSESQPRRDRSTRLMAGTALAGVSAIAAVVSYLHGVDVVTRAGARPPVAYLIPFLADLVILGATTALLDAAKRRQSMSPLSVLSLVAGVGVTLAMNVAAGFGHGLAGALVAGWPAVAFILALESLAGMVRRARGGEFARPLPATCDHELPPPPLTLDDAIRAAADAGVSKRQIALAFECGRPRVDKVLPPEPKVPELAAAGLNGDGS